MSVSHKLYSYILCFFSKAVARKLPVRQSYDTAKASSGVVNEEVKLTKRTVTSAFYTSESSSGQEHASVTPFRTSSRIAALIEKEVKTPYCLSYKHTNNSITVIQMDRFFKARHVCLVVEIVHKVKS